MFFKHWWFAHCVVILHTAVPICPSFGSLLWKREVQSLWRIRLTPKWVPDFYNIQTAKQAAVKKSWNCFFIAKMHHSGLPVLTFGAAEAGQKSVCLEYGYTSKVSKAKSRRNLQSPAYAWIKPKAQHHSPPVGISLLAQTFRSSHLQRYTSDYGEKNKQPVFKESFCK